MRFLSILVFLSMQCDILRADFRNQYSLLTSIMLHEDTDDNAIPKECVYILNEFSNYAANFTKCSIKHARPIRLCEKCIDHYVNFHKKYLELSKTFVNGSKTSCLSVYVSHDRLNIVTGYHDNILDMWDKGNCNDCFDWSEEKPVISNSTKKFNEMFNGTMECIIKNSSNFVNNSEQVCQDCMLHYVQLDEYYKSLSSDSIGVDSVCMDIVDSMNTTRIIWSQVLNCCKLRKSPEIIFLCCTGIISALPLLFYLAVRYCGPIRDLPRALKQSRFKQTILRSVNRSD